MPPTIVYYTNGILPKPLLRKTLDAASATAQKAGGNLVVSSHIPILEGASDCSADFADLACAEPDSRFMEFLETVRPLRPMAAHEANVVTGHLKYSIVAIARQIVHAAKRGGGPDDPVLLYEHDVLYPENYAMDMCRMLESADFAVYHDYVFLDRGGYFKPAYEFWHLSRYAARRQPLVSYYEQRMGSRSFRVLEPQLTLHRDDALAEKKDLISSYELISGPPVLDIKHGSNAAGQILVDDHYGTYDGWGDLKENGLLELLDDPDYAKLMEGWPELGWGLFRR